MITLMNGDTYDVRRCAVAKISGWLHLEFIRVGRAAVEAAMQDAENLSRIVYENGEFRAVYEGYTEVQRIEDTEIGVKAVLMKPQEAEA